jgi:hypothetical protein
MNDDQKALKNFMAGYFHQDWFDDNASPEEVVLRYFEDQDSVEELSSVLRALRELLDGHDSDQILSLRLLREFGSYNNPLGVGLSTRGWLQTLADEFEREIKARG